MRTVLLRFAFTVVSFVTLVLPGYAGQLDDYYLSAFGQKPGSALEKAVLLQVAGTSTPHSGTPLKHALSRDWKQLESSTQKVLAKQLAAPALSGTPTSLTSSGGHYTIHYTDSGSDAPDIAAINQYTGLGLTSTAGWAAVVGDAFETAYTYYQNLGYHMPPTDPYDVYLTSLASQSYYGFTQDIQTVSSPAFPYASSSFIQIDKDFTSGIFTQPTGTPLKITYTPLQSLNITSAHEFHHAVQYGYNYYFDIWYAEITSTWFEDEVWDSVNQDYDYIPGWFNNSTVQLNLAQSDSRFNSEAYGRWIFNRYLVEQHTNTVVRNIWEKLAGIAPTNGQDIPMVPVIDSVLSTSYNSSLSADFFGLTKRIYTRDWTSHTNEIDPPNQFIPLYVPVATYSSYPVNSSNSATPSVTLPHYSFAYYTFYPSTSTPNLTIYLNKASGIQTAIFKKAGGAITEIAANADSSYTVSGFGSLNPTTDEVALLIANTTDADSQQANFSTDNTTPPIGSGSSGSGVGSGCFIATAAYGSYLHPHVHALRNFRDKYLLTNAPGRAFVAIYYRLSPPVADVISRHETLRLLVRLLLTPIVCAFSNPGIACLIAGLFMGGGLGLHIRRRTMYVSGRIRQNTM